MVAANKAVRTTQRDRTPGPLWGVQGFTTANYYQSVSATGGIPGVDTGFWLGLLMRVDALTPGVARYIASRLVSNGWQFNLSTTHLLSVTFTNGAGASINTPSSTVQAADVGKVMYLAGVHEGPANLIKLYRNKSLIGSAAITGYTPGSSPMLVGRRSAGSTPFPSGTIFGMCGGHFVPTLAEIEAQADAIKLANDIVEIPGKTSGLWSVKQDRVGGSAPALLDDKIAADDLKITGAPVLVNASATWGW
jgi:hypothetical protein